MSVELPAYRYQPGISNYGDASMGEEYVKFPTRLNDASDVANYGYNSTLLNKSAKYGSTTDPGDVEAANSVAFWGRKSWRGGSNRNKYGIVPPIFNTIEELQAYYQARLAEADDLNGNFVYTNGYGAGNYGNMYQLNPRWNFTGSKDYWNVHPYNYPRTNGLYDNDLAGITTPLIQIGYISQLAWLHTNNSLTLENQPSWNLYYNFSNAGTARFKAVNETYFWNTSNPASPKAPERAKIYEKMWYQLHQYTLKYRKNYLSSLRQADKFVWQDSKVQRYFYATNKASQLDTANLGWAGESVSPYWEKVSARVESLDAWIYVSGNYDITTRRYTLNPDYLYLRLADAPTGIFRISRLPDSDPLAWKGSILV